MSRPRDAARSSQGIGRLARALDLLRERLWVWPAGLGVLAAVAAELLVRLDRTLDDNDARPLWVFSGNADAARSVLSTIATATMTVLGVTLSITLAVFVLTATGYSPRALRRFMRDRVIQAVIGGFVGAFVFALVALRLVREDQVPGITVNVAVVLGFVVLGLLIAFFHHMASEIQVERLIDSIWEESRFVVSQTYPEAQSSHDHPVVPDAPLVAEVRSSRTGRVRWTDDDEIAAVMRQSGGIAHVVPAAGDFIAEGEAIVRVVGGARLASRDLDRLRGAVTLGTQRSMARDVAFGIRQLTDVGLRALSPSVNDPTSAEEAILRAADIMRRLCDRRLGSAVIDGDGRVLVINPRPAWEDLVSLAFDQYVREAEAQADTATALVLIDALGKVMSTTRDPARLAPLRARVVAIRDGARRAVPEPADVARIEAAAAGVI